MASTKLRRKQNIEGNFYVDQTCIDCGTCYWMAPENFSRQNGMSAVHSQPNVDQEISAYRALFSCPTNSIGVEKKTQSHKTALSDFPYLIDGEIYHTGFHSEKSFGAASYLIRNSQGNILIDSPRFFKQLTNKIDSFGGIDFQLLTHKDDVADTDLYHDFFSSKRYIHVDDQTMATKHYEEKFSGADEIQLSNDLIVIPTPGHTKGSVCFLYKGKYLFTGDHLAFSRDLDHLYAFKNACWYNFEIQIESMEKLLDYSFEYVLPGHGAPFHENPSNMRESLKKCISWMKKQI